MTLSTLYTRIQNRFTVLTLWSIAMRPKRKVTAEELVKEIEEHYCLYENEEKPIRKVRFILYFFTAVIIFLPQDIVPH